MSRRRRRALERDAAHRTETPAHPISVTTADGWILRGEHRPREDADAVLVCGHAMMVDRRTLDRPRGHGLLSALHDAGFEVLSVDARGHGESRPTAREGARYSYDDIVRFDVPAMLAEGRAIAAGRPVGIVGHSLIAHAALIAAGMGARADALVAFAPNLWAPSLEPRRAARLAKGALLELWVAYARARGHFDARALGLGTDAEAVAYVEQFRAMWRTDRLGYEEALARASLPVLAFSSRADRLLAHPDCVAAFLRLAPRALVTHRVVDGLDHMGFVTDPRARPLWDECAAWLRDRRR